MTLGIPRSSIVYYFQIKVNTQTHHEPTFRWNIQDTGCIVEWEIDQGDGINFQWHAQDMNVGRKQCWIIINLFGQNWHLLD